MINQRATIRTKSNVLYHVLQPTKDEVRTEDIAHGLSNMCRFSGQCSEFYSVAQHSVYVSQMLEAYETRKDVLLYALLHDASEAYCTDMPRPLKHSGLMEDYREIEDLNMHTIEMAYNLLIFPADRRLVKEIDRKMCATEQRDLFDFERDADWTAKHQPYGWHVKPLSPKKAKAAFMLRYRQLTGQLTFRDKLQLISDRILNRIL